MREDLKSEVMLIVCEWDESKVLDLYKKQVLDFYIVRVILNLARSSSSPFAKKFRQQTVEFEMKDHPVQDINDIVERAEREEREDIVIHELSNLKEGEEVGLHWYSAELMRLYMAHGSYRAIEKETGIPFISCYKNIQQSFAKLKRRAENKKYENIKISS